MAILEGICRLDRGDGRRTVGWRGRCRRSGARVLGVKAILALDPQARPTSVARSPAPLVHAATKAARTLFYEIYAEFVSAFRAAADALRQGRCDVPFPVGSFPPRLPFVTS
jgi:hypothetical protein